MTIVTTTKAATQRAKNQDVGPLLLWLILGAAAVYGWTVFVSTFFAPGRIGLNYVAPGSDWMAIYEAVRLSMHHKFILDGAVFTADVNARFAAILPEKLAYRPFVYPPAFLLLMAPFGLLGFWASYGLFQLASVTVLAAGLGRRLPVVLALFGPAASINVVSGQLGFFVAGLLVAGVRLILRGSPWVGGALLGLLIVKPQFAITVPFALAGMRSWRATVAAGLCAALLIAGSAAVFGLGLWVWWFDFSRQSLADAQGAWVQLARIWGCSVYACTYFTPLAPIGSVLQWAASLFAGLCVFVAYRGERREGDRLAILLVCAMLAAPHSGPYDEVLLAAGAALWLADQTLRMPALLLVVAMCLVPMIGPPAIVPIGRLLPVLEIVFVLLVLKEGVAASIGDWRERTSF